MKFMKAIGYTQGLPISDPQALTEKEVPLPTLRPRDILVKVEAVSLNPVDVKVRQRGMSFGGDFHVPGWDVSGTVTEAGPEATHFKKGDTVYYAGSIHRGGANSEFHAVDERIVAHKPRSLSVTQAAALPLTALTAWEGLFDRMGIDIKAPEKYRQKSLLVIGGAGGVGSMVIQLAKTLVGIKVIATASRPESKEWCLNLGADVVVDHSKDLVEQFKEKKLSSPDYIYCASNTDDYFETMAALIAPQGTICSIVETHKPHDIGKLMQKSVRFAWEMMFTRSRFETDDMERQGEILAQIADLIESGKLRNTANNYQGEMTLANLRRAHEIIESGRSIGKLVLGPKD